MSFFLTYSKADEVYNLTTAGKIFTGAIILILLALLIFFGMKKINGKIHTKQLAFSGIALALAIVTSYLKIVSLPFGGSITLFSMFFICLIGYFYGAGYGILVGMAYGILQFVLEPYIYHPVQVLLDYPLAFGALGLTGLFSRSNNKFSLPIGIFIGVFGRYICHVISGYIFFASYAPEGSNVMIYTLTYNLTYILPELIATIILVLIPSVSKAIKRVRTEALS